jgi:hypothetical protein
MLAKYEECGGIIRKCGMDLPTGCSDFLWNLALVLMLSLMSEH